MPLLFVHDDLTRMTADAVVNEICPALAGGGPVNAAVKQAAGWRLRLRMRKLEGCRIGDAVLTKGYGLPAKYVIHTVTPLWNGGAAGEKEKLEGCYTRCLELAGEKGCETIAFPLLNGTRYSEAAKTVLDAATGAITAFLEDHEMTVYLVLSDRAAFAKGLAQFREMSHFIDSAAVTASPKPVSWDTHDASTTIIGNTGVIWYPSDEHEKAAVEELFPEEEEAASLRPDEAYMPAPPAHAPHRPPFEAPAPTAPRPQERPREEAPAPMAPAPEEFPCDEAPAPSSNWKPYAAEQEVAVHAAQPSYDDFTWDSDLVGFIKDLDEGFSFTLFKLIDEKGMTDVECYKKANISRKLFSKLRSDRNYRPSKTTAVAFALALELSMPETQELLARAGYTLSRSFKFDRIIEYHIRKKEYNVLTVNEVLYAFDQSLLGG